MVVVWLTAALTGSCAIFRKTGPLAGSDHAHL